MVKEELSNSCCTAVSLFFSFFLYFFFKFYRTEFMCFLQWKEKYAKLKERYSKLEDGRNALRKGLSIFEQQITKMQSENLTLKKGTAELIFF